MKDDFYLVTPLDLEISTDVESAIKGVDIIMSKALEDGDPEIVFAFIRSVTSEFKLKGISLSKMLYDLQTNWNTFDYGDDFIETTHTRTGLHRHTVERYVNVWKMFLIAPKNIVRDLQQHNIKALIPISNALSEGCEIDQDTWEELADAPDYNSVARIVREKVKGVEGRSNRLTLYMDDNGSIHAGTPNEYVFVGSLEVADDSETVQKAIQRIISNSGIMRR